MTASNPTPDDLRTIAANLKAEGQTSRAEVLMNAATKLEMYNGLAIDMQTDARRLSSNPDTRNMAWSWFMSYARYFSSLLEGDK